ncbi:MAG: DUF4190 domain-containing protein [Gemmataceae bacterium]
MNLAPDPKTRNGTTMTRMMAEIIVRRPRRRNRSSLEPHRGGTVLTMVLVGFFCCAILTIAGTIMATIDLGKMKRGEMDPEGKGMTQAAQIVGFIGIGLFVLSMIFNVVMIAFGK